MRLIFHKILIYNSAYNDKHEMTKMKAIFKSGSRINGLIGRFKFTYRLPKPPYFVILWDVENLQKLRCQKWVMYTRPVMNPFHMQKLA